ncbi:MAG: cation diffusion facilitator family transporter [Rariglobus sp.]|nr:cation diffusion facilitator family transporter [Rariglobus sp.]
MSRHAAKPHVEIQQRAEASAALVLRGIVLNLVLAIVKFSGGILGNTYALIADGVESLLDVFSSALVWAGFRVAARPPDDDHPYGHGKAEPLAAMAVGLVIFAAAVWIAIHAVHEIVTPHRSPHWVTLPLLAGIVAVKWWFSRRMARAGEAEGSTGLGAEAWHHYSDAVTSAAAFVGIAIAVVCGEGYEAADDWAALIACGVIVFNGVTIFSRALADVMDTAVPLEFENEVRAVATAVAGVLGIDKCRVRKSGLSHLVDIHVEVNPRLTVYEGHDIAHAVKDALIHSPLRISDVSVHIEPAHE